MALAGRHVVLGVSGRDRMLQELHTRPAAHRGRSDGGRGADRVPPPSSSDRSRSRRSTGRPVLTSLWERDRALAHIGLAREPDLVIVAPATAHLLARAAMGLADDVLTAMLLARTGSVLAAPAMNDAMFAHPATRANLSTLAARGWHFVAPKRAPSPKDRASVPAG